MANRRSAFDFSRIFSSLRGRIFLLTILAIIPAFTRIAYTNREERRAMGARAQGEALRYAQVISADHDRLLEGARQLLIGFGRLPEVRSRERATCSHLFADLAAQYPFYTNFAAFNLSGEAFCAGGPVPGWREVQASPWFAQAVETKDFAVGPYQLGPDGQPTVWVGYSLVDDAHRIRAVLAAALDLTWLNDLVAEAPLPPNSTLTVVGRDRRILARFPGGRRLIGRRVPEVLNVEEILRRGSGSAEGPGADGTVRLFGITRLASLPPGNDVYIMVGLPRAATFAEVDKRFLRNLLLLGLTAFLALLVGWTGSWLLVLRPVQALLDATGRVRRGDLAARTGLSDRTGELGTLGRAFDQMAIALQYRQAEAARARAMLTEQAAHLRILSQRLVHAQEAERAHIARELHDEIGQALTGIKLGLEVALRRVPGEVQGTMAELRSSINELIAHTRELSLDLRPAVLDDLGLLPALTWHFDRYSRRTRIRVSFEHDGIDGQRFGRDVETAAYRIVQEALTNVARHAGVSQVTVRVRANEALDLTVEDEGKGFPVDGALLAASGGLAGMRERATMVGGEFVLASEQDRGTRIHVLLPLVGSNGRRDSRGQ